MNVQVDHASTAGRAPTRLTDPNVSVRLDTPEVDAKVAPYFYL